MSDVKPENETPGLTDEIVADWIKRVKKGDDYYAMQIGKALEGDDPTARDFIKRASRIDPVFVKVHFPNFQEETPGKGQSSP